VQRLDELAWPFLSLLAIICAQSGAIAAWGCKKKKMIEHQFIMMNRKETEMML